MKKSGAFIIFSLIAFFNIFAQSHFSLESHQSQINQIAIANNQTFEKSYYTAGDDGFVVKWSEDNQGEHYQFSDIGIKLIAVSPVNNLIALYETDGGSVNKVTVWDWNTFTRKTLKKFNDSITSLQFSAKGNYLIIGTATVDGAVFINTSNWSTVNKIKDNTGIVNYIQTSATEKTCVLYSPSGYLSYYNMQTGSLKEKFSITRALSQVVMYNDNKLLAGVKDGTIYVINAYKGTAIASIPSENPIILSGSADENLVYLEYDGRNGYQLKRLDNMEDGSVSNPRIIKSFKGPRGTNAISVATMDSAYVYMGNKTGGLFKTENEPSTLSETITQFSQNTYSKIYAMAPSENSFYFLTENAIYKSNYDTGNINKLSQTNGENQIINYSSDEVILWTKSSRNAVKLVNVSTKEEKVLFTPKSGIQTLRFCKVNGKNYLLEIESSSSVNVYDFETQNYKEIYSGMGIQDAIFANNGNIYISKSASTNPQVPLLYINPQTLETVPVRVNGNVTYGLSTDGTTIYGLNVIADDTGRNTYIFSFNTKTNQMKNILKFADEDSDAFTYINGQNLFTNIGKSKVYCYNLSTKKRFSYDRSSSIPSSLCQSGSRVVILNDNGSISWCNATSSKILSDWYFTKDENWYSF